MSHLYPCCKTIILSHTISQLIVGESPLISSPSPTSAPNIPPQWSTLQLPHALHGSQVPGPSPGSAAACARGGCPSRARCRSNGPCWTWHAPQNTWEIGLGLNLCTGSLKDISQLRVWTICLQLRQLATLTRLPTCWTRPPAPPVVRPPVHLLEGLIEVELIGYMQLQIAARTQELEDALRTVSWNRQWASFWSFVESYVCGLLDPSKKK
jgi:hypothetical protein